MTTLDSRWILLMLLTCCCCSLSQPPDDAVAGERDLSASSSSQTLWPQNLKREIGPFIYFDPVDIDDCETLLIPQNTTLAKDTSCSHQSGEPSECSRDKKAQLVWFLSAFESSKKFSKEQIIKCLETKINDEKNQNFESEFHDIFYETQKSCLEFLQDENVGFSSISLPDSSKNLWFPFVSNFSEVNEVNYSFEYIDKCDELEFKVTKTLMRKCSLSIERIENKLPKDSLESSFSGLVLMPTIQWFCLNGNLTWRKSQIERRRRSNYFLNNKEIAKIQLNLWIHNKVLPHFCGNIIFFGHKYDDGYYVDMIGDEESRKCHQYSSRNSSIGNTWDIFSFKVNLTKTNIVFVVRFPVIQYTSYLELLSLRFLSDLSDLINFHFDDDSIFRNCCTDDAGYSNNYYFFGFHIYYYCYGMSTFCNNNDTLFKVKTGYSIFIVVMRKDVAQSKLIQKIAMIVNYVFDINNVNNQLNELIINNISIEYSYIIYPFSYVSDEIFIIKQQDVMNRLMNILSSSRLPITRFIKCNSTKYLSLCSYSYLYSNIYFIFVNNNYCSKRLNDDKMLLLVMNHWYNNDMDIDYICERQTYVAMTHEHKRLFLDHNFIFLKNTFRVCQDLDVDDIRQIFERHSHDYNLCEGIECFNVTLHFFIFPLLLNESNLIAYTQIPNSTFQQTPFNVTKKHFSVIINNFPHFAFDYFQIKFEINSNDSLIIEDSEEIQDGELSLFFTVKLLLVANLINNSQCVQDISSQRFSLHVNVSEQLNLVFGPISNDYLNSSCLSPIHRIFHHELTESFVKRMTTINKFWPTCLNDMVISFKGEKTMIVDWDYLSTDCKTYEIFLLVLSVIITLMTIVGNVLVLVVMIYSGMIKDRAYMINNSLALADLLLGLFPASLAVYDQVSLMTGALTLYDFSPCGIYTGFDNRTAEQATGFQQLRFERRGYPMVCSIVMGVSVNVSLLSLALFSLERLRVVVKGPMKGYLVALGIGISWVLGIGFSLITNYRKDGWSFVGYFDPITKLTMNMPTEKYSISSAFFYSQIACISIAGALVVILSSVALVHYRYNEWKKQKNMAINQKNRKRNISHVTWTFILMVALFGIASVPIVVDVSADFANSHPVLHFLCWWLFMAGASWNWALYSFFGKRFRKEANKMFCCLCTKIKAKLDEDSGLSLTIDSDEDDAFLEFLEQANEFCSCSCAKTKKKPESDDNDRGIELNEL